MPIYEFYCQRCNTIYNFFSRKVNTEKVPNCPKCSDVRLTRKVSVFYTTSGRKDSAADGMPPVDESRLEQAMAMLAREADQVNEDDPRQAAQLLRKLTQAAGLPLGGGMEEALARMERGEDPEQIEQEMGDLLESEDPFGAPPADKKAPRRLKATIDETLYEL